MFSFLVAIALYLTLLPGHPSLSAAEFLHPAEGLPIAAEARAAEATVTDLSPFKKDEGRIGVETSARAATAVDWETGTVLYAKNAYEPMPIASITKLMSALVVVGETPDWNAEIDVLGEDMRPGGIAYIIPGERVTVRDLFNVSLVASGNGATVTLARSTGLSGEAFAARMNALAAEIGMQQAHFTEPTGLDPANSASAHDVAVLIRRALDVPEIREAVLQKEYAFTAVTGLDHVVYSTDELLGSFLSEPPYTFLGGKTGYLGEAGYCFGAAAEDGEGHRVVAVVLGAETKADRFTEVKNLLFWVFDAYAWPN
jgi:D-alanyl-D-alanine carboxypeptidase